MRDQPHLTKFLWQKYDQTEKLYKGQATFSDGQTRDVWAQERPSLFIRGMFHMQPLEWKTSINGVTVSVC